jgi:hypothetical protein
MPAITLRMLTGLSDFYIAALTGWNDTQTKAPVLASGFDKHLVKPAYVCRGSGSGRRMRANCSRRSRLTWKKPNLRGVQR